MAYKYTYTCKGCGVTMEAASDKGLETVLKRHIAKSEIHAIWFRDEQ